MHYIQRFILDKLVYTATLRNRDMRPPNVESNLYQYHLQQLQREGFVQKTEQGYTLTARGLAYADRHSTALKKTRTQPKLITVLFVTNVLGEVLLVPKKRQPFMNTMNLPSGKIHLEESIDAAAQRELQEKIGNSVDVRSLEHFGVARITIRKDSIVISDYVALLLHAQVGAGSIPEGALFVALRNMSSHSLMPSVPELLDAYANRRQFSEAFVTIA